MRSGRIPFVTNSRNITLLHQNIAGILGKIDVVDEAISKLQVPVGNIDIICMSETFVKLGSIKNLSLNNYNVAASFCRDDERRGGTCILIKNGIEYSQLSYIASFSKKYNFEVCGAEIPLCNLIIVCIYRTPSSETTTYYKKSLKINLRKS